MAKVSYVKLGGVRSFGPDEVQEVPFQSPVTLILGENGCGKTTIIEALKFACTGETPGGGVNKSNFVFNPQLKFASKTKAVVKMKLVDSSGDQILISRGMRVEQTTPTKQTFHTIDSTFVIKDINGKERTISTRCTDLSKLICDRLGVSETILNNVIFCHQDNSLWPLDDGGKVKKKFDEIFDCAKYNKCIDVITSKIKLQRIDLKQIAEQLSSRRDKKDLVERKRAQLHKNEKELEDIETAIKNKEEEIIPLQAKLKEICEKEDNITVLKQELSSKETERQNLKENQEEIRKKLKNEFNGTDEELEEEIRIFKEKLSNLPSISQIESDINKFNALIRRSQAKLGQLNAEKAQYNDMILDRNGNINSLSSELKLDLSIALDSNVPVDNTVRNLKTALKESKNAVDELQNKFTNEENFIQAEIDKTREEVAKINQKISSSNTQVTQIKQKLREISLQLNRLENSAAELKQLTNKVEKIDSDIDKLSGSFDTVATEELIKSNKQDINKLEDELDSLEKDYKILQKNFELENNIETRSKDIREKENSVYEIKNSHDEDFKVLFEHIPENNVRKEVEDVLNRNRKIVSDLQKKVEAKKAEVAMHEANVKFKKEELSSLKDESETGLRKITNITKGEPFNEFYDATEKKLHFYQTSKGQLAATKIMYEKFLERFKSSKPCCPVCDTNFNNQSAVATVVNKIETTINKIPTDLTVVEENLKITQDLFSQLQQTKPLYERTNMLKNNVIPEVTTKLTNLLKEYTTSKSERDALMNKLGKPQQIVEVATKIMSDAALIDKYQSEIVTYKTEVEELQDQMSKIESEKSREQVEAEIKVCKLNISQKRQMCESNQKKLLEFRDQCQELREKRNKLFDKRLQLEKSVHSKPQLFEQEKELKGDQVKLHNDIKSLENELQPTKEKLNELISNLEGTKAVNKLEVSEKYNSYNKLNSIFQKITHAQSNIENFEKRNIDKEINEQIATQEQYKKELDSLNSRRDMITTSNIKQRELQDNLDIRSKQKKIEELSKVISTLETQVSDCDHSNLLKQKQIVQTKYSSIVKETCTLTGKKDQLQSTIKDEIKELDRPEFKNAYTMYCNKQFEFKIKEKTLKDLQIYSKGLENAIIEFHKEKMKTINTLLREYWRSIYRGNDIDYIEIKTEQAENQSANTRRSYNYKVVQIKNDTEIEMKGCCSAGQKVLACLIIRMALSSVFSQNCGILALDEPTTNLDRENILSLSETLAKMIEDRRVEKNFQLLVITHDEEFIRVLAQQTGSIDTCLRVKRNHKGMSVVKKETIS